MNLENPYQSPASVYEPPLISLEERRRAQTDVEVPALIIAALCTGSLLLQLVLLSEEFWNLGVPIRLLHIGVQLFTLGGAISMLKLRASWFARAAMMLACIPFLSPMFVIGIPFAIWGRVVLSRPHVKAAFDS